MAAKLAVVTAAMFGFGYVLVPLYQWACDITGFNGRTGIVEAAALRAPVDPDRRVKVQFLTTVNGQLPWEFEASSRELVVTPGMVTEMTFRVRNRAEVAIVGQAAPSVAPTRAAVHFNKTECFCFTEQRLEAGESRLMPVRFVVDERLPRDVKVMTLSYTFFEIRKHQ